MNNHVPYIHKVYVDKADVIHVIRMPVVCQLSDKFMAIILKDGRHKRITISEIDVYDSLRDAILSATHIPKYAWHDDCFTKQSRDVYNNIIDAGLRNYHQMKASCEFHALVDMRDEINQVVSSRINERLSDTYKSLVRFSDSSSQ